MNNSPVTALSIRQPWAWLIANGFKDIENRTWMTNFRGRIWIHAGKGMTRDEYEDCEDFCDSVNDSIVLPDMKELDRGGIVGTCEITGCVDDSESEWFFGPCGFVIKNAAIFPFTPMRGELGFFKVPFVPSAENTFA
jgi:hypothetical protein